VDPPQSGAFPLWNRTCGAGEGFGDVSDGAGSHRKTRRLAHRDKRLPRKAGIPSEFRSVRRLSGGGPACRLVSGRTGGVCLLRFFGTVDFRRTAKSTVRPPWGYDATTSYRKSPVPGFVGHEVDATTSKDDLCPGCVRSRGGSQWKPLLTCTEPGRLQEASGWCCFGGALR